MSRVHLQPCPTYDQPAVSRAVRACFEGLPALADRLKPGAEVLLKPNIINAKPAEMCVCTHPTVVRAVAEVALEAGCHVTIADEPGYAMTSDAAQLFASTGIAQACEGLPVAFDLLKRAGYRSVTVPNPLRVQELLISNRCLDADVLINLPKAKTHQQTLFTGAIKNMFGALAPRERIRVHLLGTYEAFGDAVADIFSCCPPHVSLMDAVIGMEGKGPSRGSPRPVGCILASEDAVALDAVAESILGYAPGEVRVTTAAAQKGLGECDLERIEVVGAKPAQFATSFVRPPGGVRRGFPGWLGKLMGGMIYARPVVLADRCTRCRACANVCPRDAISFAKAAVIDYGRCIECFCCQEVCPSEAIDTKRSYLARKIIGRP